MSWWVWWPKSFFKWLKANVPKVIDGKGVVAFVVVRGADGYGVILLCFIGDNRHERVCFGVFHLNHKNYRHKNRNRKGWLWRFNISRYDSGFFPEL